MAVTASAEARNEPVPAERSAGTGSFRPDIQGLRALAVILVVLDHAHIGPFHGGFVGVDVFFVISGFLITGLLLAEARREGRVSLPRFYARRAKRILPAASLVLAITSIASYLWLSGIQTSALLKDAVWATFFVANVKFARDETDYFAQDAATSPLQHYWSLAVEEQFYLVWPLAVLLLIWIFRGRSRRAVFGAIAAISVASFIWGVHLAEVDPGAAYFSTPSRAWELGLGAAAAAAIDHLARLPRRLLAGISWAGLAMVVIAALAFDQSTRMPGSAALLPVLGTVMLLAGGLGSSRWGPQSLLSLAPLRWVGDRSYSLYLWHWPALVLATAVWQRPHGWSGLLVVGAALVASDLSYRLVENPFRRLRLLRPTWRGLMLYPASVAVVGLAVLAVHFTLQERFNERHPAVSTSNYGQPGDSAEEFSADPHVALVQASVRAAENAMDVPNPLRPKALGLAEYVAADLDGCEYAGIPDPMPVCVRGDPDGERTMVLVGDSHMRHWIPALEPIAERHGYRAYFFVLQGCTPALVQPWSPITDAPDADCSFFHEWTQERIAEIGPDLVVMSSDTQSGYLDETGRHITDDAQIAELIEEGMVERIRSLEPHTDRIVVLADPPRLQFNPARISDPGATLEDGLSGAHPRSMLMRDAVRRGTVAAGGEHIETSQWFCAFGMCPVVVGDFITRRDRGHLTLEYSAELSGPLERALGLTSGGHGP